MFCVERPIHSWQEFQVVAIDFLKTDENYLLLSGNPEEQRKITSFELNQVPELDLIQFCSLGLFERGDLGIREIHWKVSDFITSSRAVNLLIWSLTKIPSTIFQKLNTRHKSMQSRKRAVVLMMRGFAALGYPIPHYVEPEKSTVIISRSFVLALLEFNPKGDLSFERSIFSLARTANFKCVRISGFST
jgi:hypothetical protein